MPTTDCSPRVREMYAWEKEQAEIVFAARLSTDRVRVHECAAWPDTLHRLVRRLRGLPLPGEGEHNAITLGFNCYFPIRLPEEPGDADNPFGMSWLIHELTHAWQYQTLGWRYLLRAIAAQLRSAPYDFGGEEGLRAARQAGKTFEDLNPEQQAEVTKYYYLRKRKNLDVSAWQPYLDDLRQT